MFLSLGPQTGREEGTLDLQFKEVKWATRPRTKAAQIRVYISMYKVERTVFTCSLHLHIIGVRSDGKLRYIHCRQNPLEWIGVEPYL